MNNNIAVQNEFEILIDELIKVSEGYLKTAPELNDKLTELTHEIINFTVFVPVVGMFSAGKSSLLNVWLEHDLLPVDQDATTAIATELRYAETASMKVVLKDGSSCGVLSLPQNAEEANANEVTDATYAICTAKSNRLERLQGIVPVDMPGTDSDIKSHTEALYRYAHKGAAYLLVLDTGGGTIPASLMAFLSELNLKEKPLLIALHKSDKYTDEHQQGVESNILDQCMELDCQPPRLIRTSSRENETPELLHELLTSLDVHQLCVVNFTPEVFQLGDRLIKHIETLRDNCDLDTYEITKKIQSLIDAKQDIEDTIKREEKKLSHELRTQTLEHVISDVSRELQKNLDDLCGIAEAGDQETFANKVSGIVNRVCEESLQRNISANVEVILNQVGETVSLSSDNIANTLRVSAQGVNSVLDGILSVTKKSGTTYRTVATVLAISTGVVMPVIELLIIFLPDIINYFNNPEKKRKKLVREKLTNEVFPKIKSQMRNELQMKIPEIEREIITGLREEWDARLNETISALDACRDEKEAEETDWKVLQTTYSNDIKNLNMLLGQLKTS